MFIQAYLLGMSIRGVMLDYEFGIHGRVFVGRKKPKKDRKGGTCDTHDG